MCKIEEHDSSNLFQRELIKIIDSILDMQNENKPKINVTKKQKEREAKPEMMRYSLDIVEEKAYGV